MPGTISLHPDAMERSKARIPNGQVKELLDSLRPQIKAGHRTPPNITLTLKNTPLETVERFLDWVCRGKTDSSDQFTYLGGLKPSFTDMVDLYANATQRDDHDLCRAVFDKVAWSIIVNKQNMAIGLEDCTYVFENVPSTTGLYNFIADLVVHRWRPSTVREVQQVIEQIPSHVLARKLFLYHSAIQTQAVPTRSKTYSRFFPTEMELSATSFYDGSLCKYHDHSDQAEKDNCVVKANDVSTTLLPPREIFAKQEQASRPALRLSPILEYAELSPATGTADGPNYPHNSDGVVLSACAVAKKVRFAPMTLGIRYNNRRSKSKNFTGSSARMTVLPEYLDNVEEPPQTAPLAHEIMDPPTSKPRVKLPPQQAGEWEPAIPALDPFEVTAKRNKKKSDGMAKTTNTNEFKLFLPETKGEVIVKLPEAAAGIRLKTPAVKAYRLWNLKRRVLCRPNQRFDRNRGYDSIKKSD